MGNLSFCPQSKLPPSITAPPKAMPWPPIHFVSEWITTFAPNSIGLTIQGVLNVASITKGMPAAWVIFGNSRHVHDIHAGIANHFAKDHFRIGANGPRNGCRVIRCDEAGLDTVAFSTYVSNRFDIRTIHLRGADNVIACRAKSQNGHKEC